MKLNFTDVGKLPPPVLQFIDVTFGYTPDRVLYEHVSLQWHLPSQACHNLTTMTRLRARMHAVPLFMQTQVRPGGVAVHGLKTDICRWIWGWIWTAGWP